MTISENILQKFKIKTQIFGYKIVGQNNFGLAYQIDNNIIKLVTIYNNKLIQHKQDFIPEAVII